MHHKTPDRHVTSGRQAVTSHVRTSGAPRADHARVINSGAASALRRLDLLGLDTPTWIYAFANDLEAARNITTSHLLTVIRPRLEVAFHNQRFFAVKAIEGIVMQLFLLEVRKRCYTPSIIWLHDGFWIDKHVDDGFFLRPKSMLYKSLLFPLSEAGAPLFHVTDLSEARNRALLSCPALPSAPLVCSPAEIADLGKKFYSRVYPVAKFVHKQGSKRKVAVYLARIRKHARHSWLR